MPSRTPYIANHASPPDRQTRAQRRERRAKGDEAGLRASPVATFSTIAPMGLSERRAFDSSLARGHAAIERALADPCPVHTAHPSQPCWPTPRAVCGGRVEASGVTAQREASR
jgi:hypothetical protein